MSIQAAQAARANQALQKLIRSEFGITTKAEYIRRSKKAGATVSIGEKPRAEWNRTKYNRMNGYEQQEYERKMEEKIPCYKLYDKPTAGVMPTCYTEISKTEFDYFNSI